MSGAHSQSRSLGLRRLGATTLGTLASLATSTVQAVAFWLAIVLPLAYLPLLRGGVTSGELVPFVALVAANALALAVGHDHAN